MKVAESPAFLDSVANDPRVFPALACRGQERVELGPAWAQCIGLEFDTGGWVMHCLDRGLWEVHTLFLPGSKDVRAKAAAAAHFMFTATDALELVTKVPADLRAPLRLAKDMGFTERFTRTGAWERESGAVDVTYLGLTLEEWARDNGALRREGEAFHALLGEHKDHGEDAVHDIYAGLAAACAKAGQPAKGLWLYNRWAVFAGYRPLAMDADGAVRFDGVAVRVTAGELTVERQGCPSPQSARP